MTSSNLCCMHPEERIDSPEPPARPLAAIDAIFAAATLPEDHPHALKIPHRKAATDTDIVQSPNITNKIKLQFRRSSLKDLKRGKDCDEDARSMTLKEVLADLEMAAERLGKDGQTNETDLERKHTDLKNDIGNASKRSSVNYSLPLGTGDKTNATNGSARWLTKSISSPILLSSVAGAPPHADQSCSTSAVRNDSLTPKPHDETHIRMERQEPTSKEQNPAAPLHIAEPTVVDSDNAEPLLKCMQGLGSSSSITHQGTPLYQMEISQQLRSMSQLSDLPIEDATAAITETWSVHHRDRSDTSAASRYAHRPRQISSSGLDSTTLPAGWGRVRTPIRITASSIYSRPGSTDIGIGELGSLATEVQGQDGVLEASLSVTDWPLRSSSVRRNIPRASSVTFDSHFTNGSRNTSLFPAKRAQTASRQTSSESVAIHADRTSVRLLSPPPRASSIPSKSSSSILTKSSIASRFFERFSPPKKTVRKRKSIFQFLRPGSRKQQARSVSSPALNKVTTDQAITFDGPSDDPALLTVQYELTDQPNHVARSMSMNHLGVPSSQDTALHIAPPNHQLQRQPTLAEYEKSLTVVGDDRRRPSAINIARAKEIQEEDRRDSSGLRKRLSRAHPLQDAASPLMAQALAKHQQEKALFRSASKQRASSRDSQPEPSFTFADFGRAGGSLPPSSLRDHNDLLDPLEKGHLRPPSTRGIRIGQPLSEQRKFPSATTSPSLSIQVPSTVPSVIDLRSYVPPAQPKKRIGTNLESWSRYPSHSRSERCGSAGVADAVITRDFAVDVNHEDIQVDDETQAHQNALDSPRSKMTGKSSGQRSRFSLPLHRSSGGFSGIVRYYSNLFHTRGWYGQNRRTSITTGGTLEYPELEMLPPQMAESPRHHHHSHPFQHLCEEIEKDAGKVAAYVRDEEAKLGGFVRKEEKKLEDFVKVEEEEIEGLVKKEEQKLGEFVKREEGKLRDFVVKEEDWFFHHQHQPQHHQREHPKRSSSDRSASRSRKSSPFRTNSIFEAPSYQSTHHPHRSETMISPSDTGGARSVSHDGANDQRHAISTPVPSRSESVKRTQSKAEIWSDVYRDLLSRPLSPERNAAQTTSTIADPPTSKLKSVPSAPAFSKPQPNIDPEARIRRYPSVTVIDDRKGHLRSVSLISVRTGRSAEASIGMGVERESTLDLLERIKVREREEREKLLGTPSLEVETGADGTGVA